MNSKFLKQCICLFAVGLGAAILVFVGGFLTSEAVDSQWHIRAESSQRPLPVELVNGSFENPAYNQNFFHSGVNWAYIPAQNHPDVLSGNASVYVRGWNIAPLSRTTGVRELHHYVEVQVPDGERAPDGGQYVELNVDDKMYLSQRFLTTPGSRLYYRFFHRSRGRQDDSMGLVFRDADAASENLQNTSVFHAGADWVQHSGRYDVPQNQYVTEIGFQSLNDGAEGNLIDKVEVRTGAYLEVMKSSDGDRYGLVKEGEYITYRLRIENYGQTGASRIQIRDRLDAGVEYVGDAKVNGAFVPSTFDANTRMVEIDLSDRMIGEISGGNAHMEIQYKARARNIETGQASVLHSSQAKVSYQDMGFESLPENAGGFTAYSNIYRIPIVRSLSPTQMGVSVRFENTALADMAENVLVGLYRDDVLISEANLNQANQYSHIFSDSEYESMPASPSSAVQSGEGNRLHTVSSVQSGHYEGRDHAQGALATGSDATLAHGVQRHRYDIRILGGLDGYEVQRIDTDPNHLIFVARFIRADGEDANSNRSGEGAQRVVPRVAQNAVKQDVPDVRVEARLEDTSKHGVAGERLRYEITVTNASAQNVQGIWIRDYFPKYSNFIRTDSEGSYGMIGDREFGSWFVEELAAKESRTFYIELVQDYCLPHDISNAVSFKITNSTTRPWTNDGNGP